MTRSKKNYDHLVDFEGNYLPFESARVPMLYVGRIDAAYPGLREDYYSNDETGPPRGEIWGYNSNPAPNDYANKSIANWTRVKIPVDNVFPPRDVELLSTTPETENRIFEMYLNDGRMIKTSSIYYITVVNDWVKIEFWQDFFQAHEGPADDSLQEGSPLNIQVYIR